MNKKEVKIYFEVLHDFFKNSKWLVFCMLVNAVCIGIQPFVYILLTGRVITSYSIHYTKLYEKMGPGRSSF